MKRNREQIAPPTNIGISMMLVVFLIMCLFTFSAIALVQAQNEYNNAVRMTDIRSAYYEAVSACESDLHELNLSVRGDSASAVRTIDKTYPLADDMMLSVTFSFIEREGGGYYHITDFRSMSTGEWSGNDKLNLVQ